MAATENLTEFKKQLESFRQEKEISAMYTAQRLNERSEGKYKQRNKPLANVLDNQIISQGNCMECHGDKVLTPIT